MSILPTFFNDFSMLVEGSYEWNEVILDKNDIVFDCGANIGSFSAIALSKGCEVHAFEPIPDTFALLKKNLRHYKSEKQYLNMIGLSNKTSIEDFYIHPSSLSNSYLIADGNKERISIPVTTIDHYVKENNIKKVDFIKVNIEGAERHMLLGATDTIKKYRPKLSISTSLFNDDPQIIEELITSI